MGSKNILLPPPALGGGGGGKDFPIKGTVIHPKNFKPHWQQERMDLSTAAWQIQPLKETSLTHQINIFYGFD